MDLEYTWSSIPNQPGFADGQIPMPILVADGRAPGETVISSNATVFEFNPWEMGSYDPQLFGMVPLKYIGSNFDSGRLPTSEPCVSGFDNVGFVMGTSSSLWNAVSARVLTLKSEGVLGPFVKVLKDAARKFGNNQDDIADWSPNPFYGWNRDVNPTAGTRDLTLVDGGEDGQNIPLYPHVQPQRSVDIIFAIDSSADTGNSKGWPNGTALIATYQRSKAAIQNGTAFPAIPDVNTFINLGLNARPTFFGCDAKNQSGPSPLIVYIANHPYSYFSNITTFTTTINTTERNAIIQNGYNTATMGNGTIEQEWPVCVGCAILSRSFDRTKTTVPQACADCFQRHCWNGTLDPRPVSYDPPLGGEASKSANPHSKAKKNGAAAGAARSGLGFGVALGLAAWVAL